MRILHANQVVYRRGGAEAYMLDLAALQAADGHEVAFFGSRHRENVHTTYDDLFASHVQFSPVPATLAGRISAAGRMLHSPEARRCMDRVLDAFRPDVVHLHNVYHHLSPSILRPAAERGVALVMTLHDYKLACPTTSFFDHGRPCQACLGGKFHNAVLRRCKNDSLAASALEATELYLHTATAAYDAVGVFICPSQFMADQMRAARVYPERLRVIRHFAEVVPPRARPPGGPLLFLGRLSPEKGLDVLIDAIGSLPAEVTLQVAGEGSERDALERRAESNAPGRVHFLGRVPKEGVRDLLASALAVVVPSRWYENQPLVILEAFASGVPVVASAIGGIPELVADRVDGLLVPPDDPDGLRKALAELVARPGWALQLGRTGRAKVLEHWQVRPHLDRITAAYGEATDVVPRSRTQARSLSASRPKPAS